MSKTGKQVKTNTMLSLVQARRLAVRSQLLDGRGITDEQKSLRKIILKKGAEQNDAPDASKVPKSRQRVAEIIGHLGYVQIDTIAVIERAHHHTLWSRVPKYTPALLENLLAKDRRVFEYWGHAASYLPIEDYRFYLRRMRSFDKSNDKWYEAVKKRCGHLVPMVLKKVREEGPLGATDFEDNSGRKRGGWWDWKPAKSALELLMWRGDLMVCGRRNFNRLYDLPERFLPTDIDTTIPTDEEQGDFLVRRALLAHGVATSPVIYDHIRSGNKELINKALERLTESGEVVPVKVEGDSRNIYFAMSDVLDKQSDTRRGKARVHLLSPFDNAVIRRDRLGRLFDFEHTMECYVPAPKRKHGYFVLPILWGDKFVGRLDPKADRKSSTLRVERLKLEDGVSVDDAFVSGLAKRLNEFAQFCGCEKVKIGRTTPGSLRKELTSQMKSM